MFKSSGSDLDASPAVSDTKLFRKPTLDYVRFQIFGLKSLVEPIRDVSPNSDTFISLCISLKTKRRNNDLAFIR